MNGKRLRKALVSIVAMLAVAAGAQATISYSVVGAPTPEMPGWTTWVLNLSTDTGMFLVGFDMQIGDGVTTLGQVWPTFVPTPFWPPENIIIIDPSREFRDTHFLYLANAGPAQEVVAGPSCSESWVSLTGDWAFLGGTANPLAGTSVGVAQVVLQDATSVPFIGTAVEYNPNTNTWSGAYPIAGIIPEPATLALLVIGGFTLLRCRRK